MIEYFKYILFIRQYKKLLKTELGKYYLKPVINDNYKKLGNYENFKKYGKLDWINAWTLESSGEFFVSFMHHPSRWMNPMINEENCIRLVCEIKALSNWYCKNPKEEYMKRKAEMNLGYHAEYLMDKHFKCDLSDYMITKLLKFKEEHY
ncbi:MAG: hypothetical protein ACRCZ9_02390 [Fusobacteriaceae bacterium]